MKSWLSMTCIGINNMFLNDFYIEIMTHLMGLEKMKCSECQCEDFEMETILPNQKFIQKFSHFIPINPHHTKLNILPLIPQIRRNMYQYSRGRLYAKIENRSICDEK